jgi:ribonuclease BN (tRNA processing enzyme)
MKVTILGTGGALPPTGRAQTGLFAEKGERCLLIDCGSGVLLRLDQAGIGIARVETVLLTHHHLDHMSDLLPLLVARWLREHTYTRIYGPEGTEALLRHLLELYDYVRQHVTLEIHELKSGDRVEIGGFSVECLATRHSALTLAYKIDEQFVFSGDTAPFPEMAEFAKGCEILLHECSFPDGYEISHHTTPSALGQALKGCDVKALLLTHFYPQVQGRELEIIQAIKKRFKGDVRLARDLMWCEL